MKKSFLDEARMRLSAYWPHCAGSSQTGDPISCASFYCCEQICRCGQRSSRARVRTSRAPSTGHERDDFPSRPRRISYLTIGNESHTNLAQTAQFKSTLRCVRFDSASKLPRSRSLARRKLNPRQRQASRASGAAEVEPWEVRE